ncbi:RNA polymerase sigma factor [Pedobacter endophyticus]|uniref:Sigma-70 family RNA polymerase sigma factor n=1 Tax=Pedobacter endophyticus TaxID=2789740 RepID=A0A7U3Q3E0_9SPHI|nr:sigma-70 family RNA polymerase sigma factor [Pedobacter endophyticus]QPH37830.1 sigma-70 family RNA polymerase sigma factor [Pedobacter endophyticus]
MPLRENISDRDLISMCIQGKDLGYTMLYQKYARRIYNSISRLIAHTAEAEDILQETFFNAFNDPERLQSVINFEAWVRRMAINRSISHLRKKKILFTDLGDMEPQAEADYNARADELFDCRVEDVRKSIEELSTGYKTILNLYLFEKVSQEEIAVMLGISPATVRTQYHRAKKRILLSLKDKAYYE